MKSFKLNRDFNYAATPMKIKHCFGGFPKEKVEMLCCYDQVWHDSELLPKQKDQKVSRVDIKGA